MMNKDGLRELVIAKMVAANPGASFEGARLNALDALCDAIVTYIMANWQTVTVTTTCGSGAGTGIGTVI